MTVLLGCFIVFTEIGFGSGQAMVNAEEVSRNVSVDSKDGYLQEEDAFNFVRFIFNDSGKVNSELTDDVIKESDIYKLLTGSLQSDQEKEVATRMAFLNLTYSQINHHIQSSQHALDYSRSNLQGYLEKKLAGMEHIHEQEYNSFYNSQLDNVKEALIDILCSELGKRTGIYITQNVLENLNLVIGTYNDILALPDKIQNFVDSAVAAVNAAFLPMNSELVGRYTYFSMYLDCRKLGAPDDIVFQTAMDYNFFAIKENAGLGEGVMNCLPGISGWTENRETIDRWAECVYQMEQKNNIVSTGGEEETPDVPQQNMSGKCGENAYWEYNKDTKILTITGNGEMSDYYSPVSSEYAPWHDYNIEKIEVCDNITTIGKGAFYELKNLKSIKIPSSINSIQQYAFGYCESLEQIEIPSKVTNIGEKSFIRCKNLKKIYFKGTAPSISVDAFSDVCYIIRTGI